LKYKFTSGLQILKCRTKINNFILESKKDFIIIFDPVILIIQEYIIDGDV